ncbi:hypothetical protein TrCOL_g379 [Triparma columacea]|uniref:Uncharacterized protein n=1 Tax=Triparma columacea TaxID=722753 RepID=A0A9W7G9I4_9STRA|nr:hypothetical protein TrCOL_g379 [Triparma columacea]
MYKKYVESQGGGGGEVEVLGYLAHAHFSWAKFSEASQDPAEGSKMDERYKKAMEYLRQSENTTPDSEDIAFNVVLLKNDFAYGVMSKREKDLKRTLKEVQQTKVHLEEVKGVSLSWGA